jgi:hypothetical protein
MQAINLTIPNVALPVNYKLPVAMLTLRQNVDMLTPDGKIFRTLPKNTQYRIYGVLGNYYDIGGHYLVKANSSKMSLFIGRVFIKTSNTRLYGPDDQVKRLITKGDAVRVFSYDDSRYDVGGGYYIKKGSELTYYFGLVNLKQDTIFYDKNGKLYKTLKKNTSYRVFNIDGNKLDLGGGYYILYDKKIMDYQQ